VDQQQRERFKEAVERKTRASHAASRSIEHGPPGSEDGRAQGDRESLRDPSQPQATFSPREKNTRHRKVTADKWNR
jgi:hypothetical protein